jgi:hypothetical protein
LVPKRPRVHDAKEVGSWLYFYLDLIIDKYPEWPTHQDLATQANISKYNARKVIIELENTGSLTDPEATNLEKRREKEKRYYFDPTEAILEFEVHPALVPMRRVHEGRGKGGEADAK